MAARRPRAAGGTHPPPGHQNPEVEIIRYVTEGSFDIFMWQTVERKAAFIAQVMHGGAIARELDDVGDQALATGNPHIVEKAGVDAEVAKLTRLRAAHQRDQTALARTHAAATARAARLERDAALCRTALDRRVDTLGDRFHATIDGTRHTARADAGTHLCQLLAERGRAGVDGSFAGFALCGTVDRHIGIAVIALDPSPIKLELDVGDLHQVDPGRLMQRLEHRLARLDQDLDDALTGAATARTEAERAAARLDQPFEHADRLANLAARQAELERLLAPEPTELEPPTVAERLTAVRAEPPVRSR